MRPTAEERFLDKVAIGDGCWRWLAGMHKGTGYGKFRFEGRTTTAHAAAYVLFRGRVPTGLQLDHLCRNRWCANPWHLEPVTCRENLRRGNTVNAANLAKTHCPKGHAYDAANTYIPRKKGARICLVCKRAKDRVNQARYRIRRAAA